MRAIAERGRHVFLECGPATELIGMGKQCLDDAAGHTWLNSLHAEDADATVTRQALAQLYTAGAPVAWAEHHRGRERRRITLPTYAFDRRRHWLPAPAALATAGGGSGGHPLLGRESSTVEQRAAGVSEFTSRVSGDRPAYLADHKVIGKIVFPGAGYVEMLIALQDAVLGESDLPITGVSLHEALLIADEGSVELRSRWTPRPDGTADVEIVSLLPGEEPNTEAIERRHVTAMLGAEPTDTLAGTEQHLNELAQQAGEPHTRLTADELYADFAEIGVDYGPLFQGLTQATAHGPDLAVGELRGQDEASPEYLPPAILDCAFQTLAALRGDGDVVAMPVGIRSCRLLKKPRGATLRSVRRLVTLDPEATAAKAAAADGDTAPEQPPGPVLDLLVLEGDRPVFVMERLTLRQVAGATADRDRIYAEVRWVKRSLRAADPEPRHALLIGPAPDGVTELAEPAKERNVTLTVVPSAAEAGRPLREGHPTDVCWFWQPRRDPDESLRSECERNYRDLLALRYSTGRGGLRPRPAAVAAHRGRTVGTGGPAGAGTGARDLGLGHTLELRPRHVDRVPRPARHPRRPATALHPGRALLDPAGCTVFRVQGVKDRGPRGAGAGPPGGTGPAASDAPGASASAGAYGVLTVDGTSLSLSDRHAHVAVAEVDGDIAGYVAWNVDPARNTVKAVVTILAVAASHRRRRVGTTLCEHAFARMRALGAEAVEIGTGGDSSTRPPGPSTRNWAAPRCPSRSTTDRSESPAPQHQAARAVARCRLHSQAGTGPRGQRRVASAAVTPKLAVVASLAQAAQPRLLQDPRRRGWSAPPCAHPAP